MAVAPVPSSNPAPAAPAADPSAPTWLRYVAMLTGVLAALGGYLTVQSTDLSNDAIYRSNQAVLSQTQASDAWAEYQANSIKARVVETALTTTPPADAATRAKLEADAKVIRDREPELAAKAKDAEQRRDAQLEGGKRKLAEKNALGFAGMGTQIAIALASVAALTRKKLAFYAGVLVGALSIGIVGYALLVYRLTTG